MNFGSLVSFQVQTYHLLVTQQFVFQLASTVKNCYSRKKEWVNLEQVSACDVWWNIRLFIDRIAMTGEAGSVFVGYRSKQVLSINNGMLAMCVSDRWKAVIYSLYETDNISYPLKDCPIY